MKAPYAIRNALAVGLLVIGSTHMLGTLLGQRWLQGIGLASGVAPHPKVFTETQGYEAFSSRFTLSGTRSDGNLWSRRLDAKWYAQLRGSYNRRNVYGATLAFAPRLPEELRQTLMKQALAPGSRLREELQVPADIEDLRVTITPKTPAPGAPWTFSFTTP